MLRLRPLQSNQPHKECRRILAGSDELSMMALAETVNYAEFTCPESSGFGPLLKINSSADFTRGTMQIGAFGRLPE